MGKYDGKLYALPKTYETIGIFYNKTLLEKNGWKVPTTIAELETLADEALAAKLVPFAAGNANWRPANEHYVTIVLNSIAGPENVYKALKGELPWTAEPFVAAITKLNDWWQKGYFGPDYFSLSDEQAFALMANGKAATMPTGTWQFQRVATYFPPAHAEAGFVGFPSADGLPGPVYALGVGSTFSIAAASQNPDGAAAAIDYVFTPKFYSEMNSIWQGEWNTPLVDLSAVKISDKVPALYAEIMKTLADAVAKNQYGYTSWTFLPPATDNQLVNGIEEVWLGRATVADYLAQLNAVFQKELGEGKVPAVPAR
jgi:raffinose/stachyose/melibiose transport system substrate-binding protein